MRRANAHKSWPRLAVKHSKARQRAFAEVRRILALADRAEAAGMHGEAIKLASRAQRLYKAAQKSGRLEGPVGVLPNPEARPFFCSICDSELKADAKQLPSGRWACGKCQKDLKAAASEKAQARLFEEQQGLFNPARCANVPGYRDELGQFHPIRKGKGYVGFLTTDVASPEEKAERKQKRDSLRMAEWVGKSHAQTAEQFKRKHKSLAQFVRGQGGIAYKERQRGSKGSELRTKRGGVTELGMLSPKETGTTGLLNKTNRRGTHDAERMMDAANVEGYRDRSGQKFSHIGDFISAVADDASGVRKFYTLEDLTEQGEAMSNPDRLHEALARKLELKRARFSKLLAEAERALDRAVEAKNVRAIEREQRRIKEIKTILRRYSNPPLNEWDTDEDEAFALGDKAARMLGHSRREARKGIKLYKGGYYSKLKDRHVEFIMPIEAHSAAEAKAQVKAMVTNEKPVNVTAREVKRNPKGEQHIDAGHVTIVNPYGIKRKRSYISLPEDTDRARLLMSSLARWDREAESSGESPHKADHALYRSAVAELEAIERKALKALKSNPTVSEKISRLRHEGYPQGQAVAIVFSEKCAGKVNPSTACVWCGATNRPGAKACRICGKTHAQASKDLAAYIEKHGLMPEPKRKSNPWACLECGKTFRSAAAAEKAAFGDEGCPNCGGSDIDNVSDAELKQIKSGNAKNNPGLIDLAATMQAADYLHKAVSGRKRNPIQQRRGFMAGKYGGFQLEDRIVDKQSGKHGYLFSWTVGEVVSGKVVSRANVVFDDNTIGVRRVTQLKHERESSNPYRSNPSVTALSKTFQGKASGKVDEYKASNSAPSNLARIGKLVLFVVNGKTIRIPGAMVAADTREKLWLVNAQFTKHAKRGQRLDYGPITRIIYETVKAHIEPGQRIEYDHKFENPLPRLHVDHEGCPIIAGGRYKIKREGITG